MSGPAKIQASAGRDRKLHSRISANGYRIHFANHLLLHFPGHPCDFHVLVFRGPVSPRTAEHAPAERRTLRGEGVEAVDLHLRKIEDRRFSPWETFVLNGANSNGAIYLEFEKKPTQK